MHITGDMKMVDVVQHDIQLLAVIQRFEIPLGFREKTVKEVCDGHEVNVDFFLHIANSFHDKEFLDWQKFKTFPIEWIIRYLKNAHRCYIDYRIPEIERQIQNFEKQVDINEKNIDLLLNFFRKYITEFNAHIEQEEKNVFPYIIRLNQLVNEPTSEGIDTSDEFFIKQYHEEHNNIEETLFDLKSILLKYLPPPVNNCLYNNLIYDIFRLERDLLDHAELEENVLYPLVKEMEDILMSNRSSK
ncbi:hemerythrin domain-containing protein [Carboxylicivirga mesophila]|uniref:Hemerythrin domain-containing protein n=1 Tax=Carboxylicivirga mesophila TaxID=1166478 RepID=A0ABS5KEE4_9BACT|nr:hemerythrin domain-containing protein [Carboxylicivirga mesophila]MBS2213167.1 hemerythrin domain-containing protein [Carboxylicivirga mesophila]